tara:strand:- start:501 stop:1169 length:669 start_codon:yes stop_codon:yes gene_type:complete
MAFQYEGCMNLTQNDTEFQLFKSGFQCQSNLFGQISAHQKIGIFGIYFHAHAIPTLFGIPASMLTNQNVEISDLLGTEGKQLEEQMMSSENSSERITCICNFLVRKIKDFSCKETGMVTAANKIILQRGNINIQQLAESYFSSQRHFERKFKNLTGFSPKTFARIVRFEACVSQGILDNSYLTKLTYESGYYDQSHMIKDFKAFSGNNPQTYFSEDMTLFLD